MPRRVKLPAIRISSQSVLNGANLISQKFGLLSELLSGIFKASHPHHVEGALGRGSQPRPAFFPVGVFSVELLSTLTLRTVCGFEEKVCSELFENDEEVDPVEPDADVGAATASIAPYLDRRFRAGLVLDDRASPRNPFEPLGFGIGAGIFRLAFGYGVPVAVLPVGTSRMGLTVYIDPLVSERGRGGKIPLENRPSGGFQRSVVGVVGPVEPVW